MKYVDNYKVGQGGYGICNSVIYTDTNQQIQRKENKIARIENF